MRRALICGPAASAAVLFLVACGGGSPNWQRFSDACLQGDIVVANVELSKPFDGKSFNSAWRRSKSTPLHVAASFGRTDLVRQLLQKGVDPNLENDSGSTALVEAAANGHLDTVRALLEAGAKLSRPGFDGKSPVSPALFAAASTGQTAVVKALLDAGAPSGRVRPAAGGSLLFAAALGGHDETVGLLLGSPPRLPDLSAPELEQLRQRRPGLAKTIEGSVCALLRSSDSELDALKSLYKCR